MKWTLSAIWLSISQISAWAQPPPVNNTTICGNSFTVTGSMDQIWFPGATWYLLTIKSPGQPDHVIKIGKKEKKIPQATILKTLADSLHQSNLFGTCTVEYDHIYDFADKMVAWISQQWFPNDNMELTGTQPIDDNNFFKLVQGKADKKYQLGLFRVTGDPIPLVSYDYAANNYVLDGGAANTPIILKNFDKFLHLYNEIPSTVKPLLYLFLDPRLTTYEVVTSVDGETGQRTGLILPEKTGDAVAGKRTKLQIDHNATIVFKVNYSPASAAPKKSNDDPKFTEKL
jgi:hypothetical protein